MKTTIRTLVSRAREMPDLAFQDYENQGIRELLLNAYWEKVTEENKYELLDTVDRGGADARDAARIGSFDVVVLHDRGRDKSHDVRVANVRPECVCSNAPLRFGRG